MTEEKPVGCARPTGGLVGKSNQPIDEKSPQQQKEDKQVIHVGKPAPDFVSPAYIRGEFSSTKLSDYLGKWVVLCFYPGDFTFV